ncbi:MAG: hypothetical protein WA047_04595 [Phenylobacterium sp.]|uniref:hypothetical protein n=1 Tax=Phenylobacterium sp. TaxID=1871053 RepID=UPI003BB6DED1
MLDYRIYFLGVNGRISRAVAFECEDDAAAIEIARQHSHEHAMELWQQARMVQRFEPKPPN